MPGRDIRSRIRLNLSGARQAEQFSLFSSPTTERAAGTPVETNEPFLKERSCPVWRDGRAGTAARHDPRFAAADARVAGAKVATLWVRPCILAVWGAGVARNRATACAVRAGLLADPVVERCAHRAPRRGIGLLVEVTVVVALSSHLEQSRASSDSLEESALVGLDFAKAPLLISHLGIRCIQIAIVFELTSRQRLKS